MRWIWIRHGETAENREGRYLGHADAPLNETGWKQARELAERLAGEKPVRLYTSDLLRTRQTAEQLGAVWKMAPRLEPELRELSFGEWERLTYEELMARDEERARRWYDDPFQVAPPGGETLAQLGERVDRWLHRVSRTAEQKTIAIVTHGGVIRWFQAAWLHRDPRLYWQMDGLRHGQAMMAETAGDGWRLCAEASEAKEESVRQDEHRV